MLSLFDTYMQGAHKAPAIERVHLEYCKNILQYTRNKTNWLHFIKNELFHIDLGDIWCNQSLFTNGNFCDMYFYIIKQRLFDNYKQDLDSQLMNSVKCFNYQ